MKKVGRQFSHSTMRAMGIGDDDEEFEGLRDHWLEKQISVYSKYAFTLLCNLYCDHLYPFQNWKKNQTSILTFSICCGDSIVRFICHDRIICLMTFVSDTNPSFLVEWKPMYCRMNNISMDSNLISLLPQVSL